VHNEEELKMFLERLRYKNQLEFGFMKDEEEKPRGIIHKKSYSKYELA
jgi:hypothetical protein